MGIPRDVERLWRISVFGAFAVRVPSGQEIHVQRPKAAELLAYLALRRSAIVDREAIVQALWPDADTLTGRNRLKQTLSLLRSEVGALPIVVHGKNALELPRELVEVESETVEARMKWLRALRLHERADASRQLWETVRQGLLPEIRAPWVFADQDRFAAMARKLGSELRDADAGTHASFRFGDEFAGAKVQIVGREAELAGIAEWLGGASPAAMILVGPPGVGKTRLLHEATQPASCLCDAVIWLSTVQFSEAPWLDRIGQVIGVRGPEMVTESLVRLLLGFKRPLLAVDDIDQADAGMIDWLGTIRRQVPDLKVLGTARRRHFDSTALDYEIAPLRAEGPEATDAQRLLTRFAVHFGVKANALSEQHEQLHELATMLEGLPLSLEVAAGWLPFVQPDRLVRQLRSSPNLVISRDAQAHDSLTKCVEAIDRSLPESELVALRCLSVCRGGCGEDLAEEMFGEAWVWSFRALSERSLLSKSDGQRSNRFVVLQALRHAVTATEPPELMAKAEELHRLASLRFGWRVGWGIDEGDRGLWLNTLRDECDNLLLACSTHLDDAESCDTAAQMLDGIRMGCIMIGRPSDFERVYRAACTAQGRFRSPLDPRVPYTVVLARLREMCAAGRHEDALRMAAERTSAIVDSGYGPRMRGGAHDIEGELRIDANDLPGAIECFLEAERWFEIAGCKRQALWLEAKIAHMETRLGLFEQAHARRLRSLDRAVEIGDHDSVGMYCKEFARLAIADGRWADALALAWRAIESFIKVGEVANKFSAYLVLTAAHLGRGDRAEAARTLAEAAEFAPVANNRSLADYNSLKDAITLHVPIDLHRIDCWERQTAEAASKEGALSRWLTPA